jgi:uncharacterized protein (DUF1684 family)
MKTFTEGSNNEGSPMIFRPRLVLVSLLLVSVLINFETSGLAIADGAHDEGLDIESHRSVIEEWRQRRHQRLASDNGWLTLVGLEWLQEGDNRIGKGEGNDIRLTGGPDYWGTVVLEQGALRFIRAPGDDVAVDGALPDELPMLSDADGEPTLVQSGNLSFYPIFRESYALRVKDSQAAARIQFEGIDNYDIQSDWRVNGRFIQGEEGQTIEMGNVLGQLSPSPVAGMFEFEREGKTYRLITLIEEDSDSLWIVFADRTNGHGSYGAGRMVYSDGMPENGRLVVDFNKAYNPPCAFTDYSTCPIPPQQNRLNLAVMAGEKDYHEN